MESERFNPDMLKLARELREWTQSELADRAGVTQGYVSMVEHGEKEPSPEKVEKFARLLGYPPGFFHQPDAYTGMGLSIMFYRKKSGALVGHLRRMEAEANLRRIQVSRLLRGMNVQTPNTFSKFDIDDHDGNVEKIAQFVRASWKMPVGPIRNLVNAIEGAGGLVFKFNFGTPNIDAMSIWPSNSVPLFFINAEAPADRIRFSLAHELGHVVMHSEASDTMEKEADRFAAEFLMPQRDIGHELGDMTIPRAAALKPYWRVSMASLIRRARDTGRLPEAEYLKLVRRMSVLGYRRREPGPIAPEEPMLVPGLLDAYTTANGFTVKELASISRVYEADFSSRFSRQSALRIAN